GHHGERCEPVTRGCRPDALVVGGVEKIEREALKETEDETGYGEWTCADVLGGFALGHGNAQLPRPRTLAPNGAPGALAGLHRDQDRAGPYQRHAQPVESAELFAEEKHPENRHQHDRELVDGRHARGVAELEGVEIAEPRGAGAEPR